MAPKKNTKWDFEEISAAVVETGKTVLLYGWVPFIIALGVATTEPRPTLAQLLGPF